MRDPNQDERNFLIKILRGTDVRVRKGRGVWDADEIKEFQMGRQRSQVIIKTLKV